MTARKDLLALTPAAIASLSNMGLLKRAQKELDEGKAPSVELLPDGTLAAAFQDGAKARLVPGKSLKDCPCSCGATSVCRHRVGAILAYQRAAAAAPADPAAAPQASAPAKPWSPADIDDAALEKLLGKAALDRARALRRRGVLVEVIPGNFEGDALPRAQLPTSTVRFLVAFDPGYARCDCRLRTGCEHVALAVWAFRVAEAARDAGAASQAVELADAPPSVDERRRLALEAAQELCAGVILEGAARLSPAVAARFALARLGLERAHLAWPLSALEEVEALAGAYGRRSAVYTPQRLASCLAEVFARARAGLGGGELPVSLVLGSDEPPEAALDQVRLASLGARVQADGDERSVEVLLADPHSQSVLVLRREYRPQDGKAEDGPELARRAAVSGSPLGMVATGQIVSNAAVRRPSRLVSFSTGPLKKTSVLAGGAALEAVPPALVVTDGEAFAAAQAARPPRALRARLLAEDVRAFSVARVVSAGYLAGEQAVRAVCEDGAGNPFRVELRHRAQAPAALEALALHLGSASLAAVIGEGTRAGGELVVEPIAVVADRLVALDLEASTPEGHAALAALPRAPAKALPTALAQAVDEAREALAQAVHGGMRAAAPGWSERLREARAKLHEVGLERAAKDLHALELAQAAAGASGAEGDERRAVEAWATAALRLQLVEERL